MAVLSRDATRPIGAHIPLRAQAGACLSSCPRHVYGCRRRRRQRRRCRRRSRTASCDIYVSTRCKNDLAIKIENGCPLSSQSVLFFTDRTRQGHPFLTFRSIRGHPFLKTWEWRGIRFHKMGIRFFKTPFLEGISCNQLLLLKLKKAIQQHTRFAPHTEARLAKRSRSHFRILQSPLPWL